MPEQQTKEAGSWLGERATWSTVIAALLLLGAAFSFFSDFDVRIHGNANAAAANAAAGAECARRQDSLAEDVSEVWEAIRNRPNPLDSERFRGLEGDVHKCLRLADKIEILNEQVRELRHRVNESMKYYRDSVLPALTMSNDLQLQRNQIMYGSGGGQ